MKKDKTKPLFHWYVDGHYGKELVFALYTRPCRYGRCAFCSLPFMAEGGEAVLSEDIEKQIDYIISHYTQEQIDIISKVSIYTASSVLDQECLPTRSLMYLMLKISYFKNLKLVSLETRPEYVEDWELKAINNVLPKNVSVEVGIGYETHNLELRNKVLEKGLTPEALNSLLRLLAENKMELKAYLMLKPHYSLNEEEGVVEAINGLIELDSFRKDYGIPVSVHLNPTYIAADCRLTDEMIEFGYKPPELSSVIKVLEKAAELKLNTYVGLDDEGMAVEGGTFRTTGLDKEKTVEAIKDFNKNQDIELLLSKIK